MQIHNKKGFTIPELLIAITILSILSTIAFISYTGYSARVRDTARISDIKNITKILDLFKLDTAKFPNPTDGVDITHSWALVWTQWVFWKESANETRKIFGDLRDPLYDNSYSYSTTSNRKEYQISAIFENEEKAVNLRAANIDLFPKVYAAGEFSPLELNPTIWLDGNDVDGDGDTNDNPSNGDTITSWVNKSTVGNANNPTITQWSLRYTTNGLDGLYPGVFIKNNAGLRLNNSDITQGDIFYVVHKNDPFWSETDTRGYGLYSANNKNFLIGYWDRYRDAIRMWNAPRLHKSSPATRSGVWSYAFIYGFHTDSSNYSFRDVGVRLAQGATNSVSWHTWAFNKAGSNPNKWSDLVVSEILIFNHSLSTSERQKVEWYLAHKWWQDSWLSGSHPYKNNPPESSGPPPTPDTIPDAFTLDDITGANVSQEYPSNAISVVWINTTTAITISGTGASYSVNNGSYTTNAGQVNANDTVRVLLTSAPTSDTTMIATLTIGWISEDFSVKTFTADTLPDAFSFWNISDANLNTDYFSNAITVSWVNTQVWVSITGTGAKYRISDGISVDATWGGAPSSSGHWWDNIANRAFDNSKSGVGWGSNGSLPWILQYDFWVSDKQQITKYSLYRSNWSWRHNRYSPRNWTFEASNDGTNWTVLDTRSNQLISRGSTKREYNFTNNNYYRYYRINISAGYSSNYVNITEMEMVNLGSGVYTSSPWIVNNGDVVNIMMPSSATAWATKTAKLTVWSASEDFRVTTYAPDTIPDTFSFTDKTDVALDSLIVSDAVDILGINTPTSISISAWAEYQINNGSFLTTPSNIEDNDRVKIRLRSSPNNSETRTATLTIGWVEGVFNVVTPAPSPDFDPDPIVFEAITNANLSTEYESNTVTITGINRTVNVSISWWEYAINDSQTFTSGVSTLDIGDTIRVKWNSHAQPGNTVNVDLTVWGTTGTFPITTIAADPNPDTFTIGSITNANAAEQYISDPVTITGINVPIAISVSWGQYSINGWDFTSSSGQITNNSELRLKRLSSGSWRTSVQMTVNVWSISRDFIIQTWDGDSTPDTFSFVDESDANLSSQYVSTSITVTGTNAPAEISIVDGQYRIGATGDFTADPGVVNTGDEVTVKLVSSNQPNTTSSATLTIGGVSDSYDVTTKDVSTSTDEGPAVPESPVFVGGRYNGLIAYGQSGSTHYIFATPSIIAYDLSNTNFLDIISGKKLVYRWYNNIPASYAGKNLTMSGGFDFNITDPILYEWSKEDLGSYSGLKQIDDGIRSSYSNFEWYQYVAEYLDDYSLNYLEEIVWENVGINPIKPYYCSDILRSKLVHNIAPEAEITASEAGFWSNMEGIANGEKGTEWILDYEYHSADPNATIEFEWEKAKKVGYVRIYNRTSCCTNRLTGANIKLYNEFWWLMYSHSLWDTTNDFVIDLDLEWIGQLHNVKKMTIESVWGNYLNLREVEIFLWGQVESGIYKVDKDGLGWLSPYKVYCDMETDGGGWTRIGQNYVSNGQFLWGSNIEQHTFQDAGLGDNVILDQLTQLPPSQVPDAQVLRHNGWVDDSYEMFFEEVPGDYFTQEIRLSLWVKGTTDSVFNNTVRYADGRERVTTPDYEVVDTDVNGWEKRVARISLEDGLVEDFRWNMWEGIAWGFYATDFNMEVYYK